MKSNHPKNRRKNIRLKGFDYSSNGRYFITICTQDRKNIFSTQLEDQLILNEIGRMVESEWLGLTKRFQNIRLHNFVIMPNHIHAIIEIVGSTLVVDPTIIDDDKKKDKDDTKDVDKTENINSIQIKTKKQKSYSELISIENEKIKEDSNQNSDLNSLNNQQNIEKLMGQPRGIDPTGKSIGEIIGAFKSIVTVNYIYGVKNLGWPAFKKRIWQRNYYEHIIRNEKSYINISNYIINNPKMWQADTLRNKSKS